MKSPRMQISTNISQSASGAPASALTLAPLPLAHRRVNQTSHRERYLMKQRIVILGGGFGGLYTALELEKRLGADSDVEITLVNRDNFFLFTPMLHEVAASDLDPTDIVNPIRKLLRQTQFFVGN